MDTEYIQTQFLSKIEFESEKIKMIMLGTSKANIYASSKEIHVKKQIRNKLILEFSTYTNEDKIILLGISDLIEQVYSIYLDRENIDAISSGILDKRLHEIIKEIISREKGGNKIATWF